MQYAVYYLIIYTIVLTLMAAQLSEYKKIENVNKKKLPAQKQNYTTVIFSMVFVLIIRMAMSVILRGHETDMYCFDMWARTLFVDKPWNFYWSGQFADYPPGYMIVLWFVGAVNVLFKIPEPYSWIVVKLPAMICDVILAGFIYKIAREKYSSKFALNLFHIFVFNPLVCINSVFWGQIDSILTLFLIISFYEMQKKEYVKAALWFVTAALMKPQALVLFPIYIFIYLRTKDWKMILRSVGLGLILMWVSSVAFSPAWKEASGASGGIFSFFETFNILWVFEKFLKTLASYEYATINAYNFYTIIFANWRAASERFLFATYGFWGNVVIIAAVALSVWFLFKSKKKEGVEIAVAAIMFFVLFTIGTKMHERYLYPAVIFMLILYIINGDKRLFLGFVVLSFINYLNVAHVLFINVVEKNTGYKDTNVLMMFLSVAMVIAFGYYTELIYKLFVKSEDIDEKAVA